MKNMTTLSLLFFVSSLFCSELDLHNRSALINNILNKTTFELSQHDNGYSLHNNKSYLNFANHQVSKSIRDLEPKQLAALLESKYYYLKATDLPDGTPNLDIEGRLLGGANDISSVAAAVGGAAAVSSVFYYASISTLYLAKATIHVVKGSGAGADFGIKMTERLIPQVSSVAALVGAPVGAALGVIASFIIPT